MLRRPFGGHGTSVSAIGLGTSQLNPISGPKSYSDAEVLIRKCVESGINFFDTADSYGAGRSESWLGKALRTTRDRVMISTKFGLPRTFVGKATHRVSNQVPADRLTSRLESTRFSRRSVIRSVDGSLRRLQTDYIDVLLLHSPPLSAIASSPALQTLADLKAEGKVRYVGVSTSEPAGLKASLSHEVDVLQTEVNVCNRDLLAPVLADAQRAGVAVVGRQVFGSGRILEVTATANPSADRQEIAQALLSEALSIPDVSTLLIGMRSIAHFESNLAVVAEGWTGSGPRVSFDEPCTETQGAAE